MNPRIVLGVPVLLGAVLVASQARAQDPPPVVVVVPPPPPPRYDPNPSPEAPSPYPELSTRSAEPVELERRDRGFSAKLYAGPSYQRVFDAPIAALEFGAFAGGVKGISGWYGGIEALVGRMDPGLTAFAVRPQASWEARLGRVHLGLGLGFVVLGVTRATTGELMTGIGSGPSVFCTVDLVRSASHTLFLGAKMRVDFLAGQDARGSSPILWGPSASVGWRYR